MKAKPKSIHSIKMIKRTILSGTVVLFLFGTAWSCKNKVKNNEPKEFSKINTELQMEVRIAAYQTLSAWLDQGVEVFSFYGAVNGKLETKFSLIVVIIKVFCYYSTKIKYRKPSWIMFRFCTL